MPDVLIYADSMRSPELRHEVPLDIGDPFLYAEKDGLKHVVVSVLEGPRLQQVGGFEIHPPEEFGYDEIIKGGGTPDEMRNELLLRAVRGLDVSDAIVPFWFPLQLADHLRANGIGLRPDREFFAERRRVKSDAELAGIRRAQRAAEAGMAAARDLLRRSEPNGTLTVGGEPLTVERIKVAIEQAYLEHGCTAEDQIVARGAQGAVGHDMGSGAISAGEPVVIDLWPRDRQSACYADMTRTFVVGTPPPEIEEWQRLCKEALEQATAAVKPGAIGRDVFDLTCEIFERAGHPTQRTKESGKPLDEGFFHGLGHGVGLEVHEEPGLGLTSKKPLVAGDVITIEPGLYRQGFGGVRLEDLVLVTEDGAEVLTDFPYDLQP